MTEPSQPEGAAPAALAATRIDRRSLAIGAAALLGQTLLPRAAAADVPAAYDRTQTPPMDDRQAFIDWMVKNRGEDAKFLGERYDRFHVLVRNRDLWNEANKRAFLLTPRESFVRKPNLAHTYDNNFLDIGFGVTISGPHLVGRMTSVIDVQPGNKVLEIGTGSGYQSALLTYLTPHVHSIEIIPELAARTRGVYDRLIGQGYHEYGNIVTKSGDGYYGWEDAAPFDKIIVTCGIDHIPPPLLQQLRPGGIMVIPIGPPGAQHILKVVKKTDEGGAQSVSRSDIFGGKVIPFVPLSGGHQSEG